METKTLRWTAEVTRMDCIRNDVIRQKFGVAPIADKMREARLRCWKGQQSGLEDAEEEEVKLRRRFRNLIGALPLLCGIVHFQSDITVDS
ncbi:unnamed protein product [Heligmosomoides polygyrus]|uniref:Uncharacterized protein n=1 Tax=Heligmosomoides polygyrus TaxID=6339 RepID=A0A183GBT6_HELPZ|nr:unnamed protein product [Heligmosomoides polygyrus]